MSIIVGFYRGGIIVAEAPSTIGPAVGQAIRTGIESGASAVSTVDDAKSFWEAIDSAYPNSNQNLMEAAKITGSVGFGGAVTALVVAPGVGVPIIMGAAAAVGIALSPAIAATAAIAAGVAAGYAAGQYYEDVFDQLADIYSSAEMAQAMDDIGNAVSDMFDSLGDDISDAFIKGAMGFGDFLNGIGDAISDLFTAANNWLPPVDPLTLDLDSDGLETLGLDTANPILFDHDGDGVKTASGWVAPDDGFLVLDRNGNGTIDSGRELFGDETPLVAGGTAADGFAALALEDTNLDGKVDAADARFADLRVWRDLNQDGISQASELTTLTDAGIAALNVAKTANSQTLANGNRIADLGSFTRTDGSAGTLGDLDLAENTFVSQFTDSIPLTAEAEALPDMQGSGQVRDLREAASLSATLATTLGDYAAATTRDAQMAQLDDLIEAWAASSGNQTSIELAEEQGYRLGYLIPGLKSEDFVPQAFAFGSGVGSNGLIAIPDPEEIARHEALMVQQAEITELIALLKMFNGITFVNIEPEGVRTGANDEVCERAA